MSKKSTQPGADANNASAGNTENRYAVLLPYTYHYRDQKKTGWTDVGVAFRTKDGTGFSISLRPGLAVQGRLVLKPVDEKKKPDAADSHMEPAGEKPMRFVYNSVPDADLI